MIKRYITLFILLLILTDVAMAQFRKRGARWKRTRWEIVYGIGATNMLGELGGADAVGTNFFKDFEVSMTRPLGQLGIRYKLLEKVSVKAALTYGVLRGDDKTTNEFYRNNRNLSFKSNIIELSAQFEYSAIKEKTGHRYNLRKVKGIRGYLTNTYFFIGVAGFYFNPKAYYPSEYGGDDKWHALQPLGTEGQGLVPTRKKYRRVQVAIPIGMGFKYGLNRKWSVGLEYGMRKTFTDYIDDVSSTYYDNDKLRKERGDAAAYLADPSISKNDEGNPNWTGGNQQRGDAKDKDAYMFLVVSLTYKLKTGRNGMPKF